MTDPAAAAERERLDNLACGYHLTLTTDGWIGLRCITCQHLLLAATHLDLWDWLHKAGEHEAKCHPDGQPDADVDAGCHRCADLLDGDTT
jgi:hypothetical protein